MNYKVMLDGSNPQNTLIAGETSTLIYGPSTIVTRYNSQAQVQNAVVISAPPIVNSFFLDSVQNVLYFLVSDTLEFEM